MLLSSRLGSLQKLNLHYFQIFPTKRGKRIVIYVTAREKQLSHRKKKHSKET